MCLDYSRENDYFNSIKIEDTISVRVIGQRHEINNPKISSHYKGLLKTREQQFLHFINVLKQKHILREEELDNEYCNLYTRFQILSDFWLASAETTSQGVSLEQLKKYRIIILQSIFPYLTQKGKQEFKLLIIN